MWFRYHEPGLHFAVFAAALVAGMVMFALGWIGGGDAKLFAAAALWLGWPACFSYAAFTALAGGGLALALMGLRSAWVRPFVPTGPAWFGRLGRCSCAGSRLCDLCVAEIDPEMAARHLSDRCTHRPGSGRRADHPGPEDRQHLQQGRRQYAVSLSASA